MWGFEIGAIEFDGHTVIDASEEYIFVTADGDGLKFSG